MTTALLQRARVRALIERGARRVLSATGASEQQPVEPTSPPVEPTSPPVEPTPPAPPPAPASRFARESPLGRLALERTPATDAFFARLDPADVAEVERGIAGSPELRELYERAPSQRLKHHMVVPFGVYLGVRGVIEKTGLGNAEPPPEIHAMSRGPLAAAGGLYEADMVVDALASAGADIAQVRDGLDFGCSSARVVRALSTLYPDVRWHGCDPNEPAIAWAAESLPDVDFFVSGNVPPLPRADGSLDLIYAISIWSHFAPALGLRWLTEMHRLLRPGGHLVCTTHGLTSVAYYATHGLRAPEHSEEIRTALYSRGWWYAPEFGEQGDWGVVNPDWGTAFLTPEWMLTHLCPRWRVLEFAPGRNQNNQDVYVLQRV